MNAFNHLKNKLTDRIQKVKVLNPKANRGEVWLHTAKNILGDKIMMQAIAVAKHGLTSRFRSDTSTPQGHAMAAELTINIGRNIMALMPEDHRSNDIYLHAVIGSAILGVFLEDENLDTDGEPTNYIEMYRDPAYSEHDKGAPYVIVPTMKYAELADIPQEIVKDMIRATVNYEIPKVSDGIQVEGHVLIKDANDEQTQDILNAIEADLPWIRMVNSLQQQAWMINEEVLEVILGNINNLLVPVPQRPYAVTANDVKVAFDDLKKDKNNTKKQKAYNDVVDKWNLELASMSALSKNDEVASIRAKAMHLAYNDKYKDGFYQFVDVDYRGRVYYKEPLLNYQGPDMSRGLLLFKEGKPLGQDGVRWLAIHTANSYNATYNINKIPKWCTYDYKTKLESQGLESISVDKMTLKDRELWTWENMKMILASADKLVDCEKSVSFLACCIEWTKVQKDGFDTISHLPVAIDGSCNGYQHSAAIAKDEITGGLVSLTHQEVQEDLYVEAAQELVKRMPKFFAARPTMEMKHIRKGITKRAIMTRAYSAGKEKIADSMYKDCHTEGYTKEFNITMLDCVDLANTLYDLIKDICPGATRTMKFLQDLVAYELGDIGYVDSQGNPMKKRRKELETSKNKYRHRKDLTEEELVALSDINKELLSHTKVCTYGNGERTVDWWTPSGFHVVYEAFRQDPLKIEVTFPGWKGGHTSQPGRVKFSVLENTEFPDRQKFSSGISPNFIHSLDAAHMAIVVAHWGGSFGAVHDSFSAHASDIEELSELTREKFVDLYDIHDPYAAVAEMVLSPCVYDEELPELGSLDIGEVRSSTYFFC